MKPMKNEIAVPSTPTTATGGWTQSERNSICTNVAKATTSSTISSICQFWRTSSMAPIRLQTYMGPF